MTSEERAMAAAEAIAHLLMLGGFKGEAAAIIGEHIERAVDARTAALREALARLEWIRDGARDFCAACGAVRVPTPDDASIPAAHARDCWLRAALAAAPGDAT